MLDDAPDQPEIRYRISGLRHSDPGDLEGQKRDPRPEARRRVLSVPAERDPVSGEERGE
jgi:hypothetical protein